MPNPRILRPLITALAAAAVAAVTLLAASSPALAAKGGPGPKPATASASATVSGSDVTLGAKVNRPAADIASVDCDLDGNPVACASTGGNKKNTSYGATVSGLDDGDYTFHVTFTLTNNTLASASASFTIDNVVEPPPPPGPEAACASVTGAYTTTFYTWSCAITNSDGLVPDVVAAACNYSATTNTTNNGDGTFSIEYACPREPAIAQEACGSFGGFFYADEVDFWACNFFPGDGSVALVDTLTAQCTAMGWSWFQNGLGDGQTQIFCTTL